MNDFGDLGIKWGWPKLSIGSFKLSLKPSKKGLQEFAAGAAFIPVIGPAISAVAVTASAIVPWEKLSTAEKIVQTAKGFYGKPKQVTAPTTFQQKVKEIFTAIPPLALPEPTIASVLKNKKVLAVIALGLIGVTFVAIRTARR